MTVTQIRPDFDYLKQKWNERHTEIIETFHEKHKESLDWLSFNSKQFMLGSMAGLVMLSHPAVSPIYAERLLPAPTKNSTDTAQVAQHNPRTQANLISDLAPLLPSAVQSLSTEQEMQIAQKLSDYFQMSVSPILQGKRLNRSYGIIGAEQHLMRYPGDTMETHFTSEEDKRYWSSGMAPGRGAWGYFADSADTMSPKDIEREKYYIAVQSFLAPGWNENVNELYAFFKYRKMLVVNPENGKAIVVVIGDAGPAEWTGKHLGGSPEVMMHLERQDGGARGPVLYYFIDDPEDKIPLGPVMPHN
ncbi:hypothetical protein KAZ66_02575 [Candidatus Woesebacteria bacterium]|nr:hypothetical protein [Candidatus Woesebacteria bacterium]